MSLTQRISALDHIKDLCNSNVGCVISRKQIILKCPEYLSSSHIDTTRRLLVICDYLENTGNPGFYKVIAAIPENLTSSGLRKLAEEKYASHHDTFVNNSEKLTNYLKEIKQG